MINSDRLRPQANLLDRNLHAKLPVQCHLKGIKAILTLIIIATLLRILFAGMIGLGVDESYTVGVARQLSLSYFDHPPLHIWIIGTWSSFWGSENALLLRLPFIALFAGSTWLLFLMTRRLFGERPGIWAAFAFNLAPVFTLSTGSWIIPDGTLVFFLLATANILTRLLFNLECEKPMLHWIGAGALAGLALLSKYIAIFFMISIFVFLITSSTKRHWLTTPGPWLGAVLAGILFLPVVIWNIDHNWASFAFQGGRTIPREFNLNNIMQYIGGQFVYLLPWIFLPLSWCLGKAIAKGPSHPRYWFLACLTFLPVAFFSLIALWTRVLPHWPSSGWLFMFPLLGNVIAQYESVHCRLIWVFGMGAALFDVLMFTLLGVHAATGFLVKIAPEKLNQAFVKELLNWSELKAELTQRGLLQEETFIAGLNWINSGKLNYALGNDANVLCLSREPHQFGVDNILSRWEGGNGIIAGTGEQITAAMPMLRDSFEHIELLAPVTLLHGDAPALELTLMRGMGFKHQQVFNVNKGTQSSVPDLIQEQFQAETALIEIPLIHWNNRKIGIIMPTFNERDNLSRMLAEIRRYVPDAWILIVDDSSPDGTGTLADHEAVKDPLIEVYHRPSKLGLGTAYIEGFQKALKAQCNVIVQMDADFSHDPSAIPQLIEELAAADLVLGSRYVKGGTTANRNPLRECISLAGSLYASAVLGLPYRDLTGGFKAWRATALKSILSDEIISKGYAFQLEMTYRSHRAGLRIREIPIHFHDRRKGQSKMNFQIVLEALYICFWLRWNIP